MEKTESRNKYLKDVKRVVVKVGTSTITDSSGALDEARITCLARDIMDCRKFVKEIIIVTSGAITAGKRLLKSTGKFKTIPERQAAASAGQVELMNVYSRIFRKHGAEVGQILLTQEDLRDRKRYLNARNTIMKLFEYSAIPVINENDTVAVNEIKFGDNDTLSAHITNLAAADLLIILTDTEGFKDDSGRVMGTVPKITEKIFKYAGGTSSSCGTGGMVTKLISARMLTRSGVPVVIAAGYKDGIIKDVLSGEETGSIFLPLTEKLDGKKRWIAFNAPVRGSLVVDGGAQEALTERGKSLLPKGIISLSGRFPEGAIVSIKGEDKKEFARGLTNYSSEDIEKIMGKKTSEIAPLFGQKFYDEVVHRDNLVII